MTAPSKSIGVLGGSFDPVHNGHITIAESFLASDLIDELWILLTPDPPHKTNQHLTDFEHRFVMLKMAFDDIEAVKISDLETELPQPSYTVQTLRFLHSKYSQHTFFLCMGGDSLSEFIQWKDWETILSYCNLLVAQRPSNPKELPDPKLRNKVHFVDHEPISISSTEIRKRINKGKDITGLVPVDVENFINQNSLYRKRK